MMRVTTVFYYLTDPETAQKIAEKGFTAPGIYSAQSTMTLLDNVPGDMGGGILRVAIAPERIPEVMRHEASDPGESYRKFLVPMELLKHAYVARVKSEEPAFPGRSDGPATPHPAGGR